MALKIAQHWIEMNRLFGFLLSSTIYTHIYVCFPFLVYHCILFTSIREISVLWEMEIVNTHPSAQNRMNRDKHKEEHIPFFITTQWVHKQASAWSGTAEWGLQTLHFIILSLISWESQVTFGCGLCVSFNVSETEWPSFCFFNLSTFVSQDSEPPETQEVAIWPLFIS